LNADDFCPECRPKAEKLLEKTRILEEFFNRQRERFGVPLPSQPEKPAVAIAVSAKEASE